MLLVALTKLLPIYVPGSVEVMREFWQRPYYAFALLVPLAAYYLPRYRRSARLSEEGERLLGEGRVFAALEKFEAARPLAKSRVISTYNIGLCRLNLWQLEEAERELTSLLERDDLLPEFKGRLYALLAVVAALEGRERQAWERLDEAKALRCEGMAAVVVAMAVLACRRRHWEEAQARLKRLEPELLTVPLRGLREALLAWCEERLTGERRPVDVVAVFGEASPDKLEAAWPELVSFLLEHARK